MLSRNHARPRFRTRGVLSIFLTAGLAVILMGAAPPPSAPDLVGVTVVVENLAPQNGTWLTPVWVGFHAGTYDLHDPGSAASQELERLAEDGNTSPLSSAFAAAARTGAEATLAAAGDTPQIPPGGEARHTFLLDPNDENNAFVSWAAMVIPSNDAFVANDDPQARRIFDANGNFLGAFVTLAGSAVLDAGTEVNDEVPAHTAFFGQTTPNTGVDENGVVHLHPGYLPPGSGGILDDPMFADADFTAPGYQVARITIYRSDTVVPAGNVSGHWTVAGSPYLVQGDVTVPDGATLTIDPGVTVFSSEDHGITVAGALDAVGTADVPILFTGTQQQFPNNDGWSGLRFIGQTLPSHLAYCTIEYGDRQANYESGGGIACIGGQIELRHCTVRSCLAYLDGAGLYASDATLLLDDCEVRYCEISGENSGRGGGIFAENSDVTITNSHIHHNRVATFTYFGATNSRGGGIALVGCTGSVEGCVINRNYCNHSGTEAESTGGGVHVENGTILLRGDTVVANEVHYNNAHGGGIYLRGYGHEVVDTIVSGNTGAGIWFDPGAETATIDYNDAFGNSGGSYAGPYVPSGLGIASQINHNGDPCDFAYNIDLSPQFVAPTNLNYHLQATSPCIDAGDPASPPDPDGTIADIGALPYDQGATAVPGPSEDGSRAFLLASRPAPMDAATTIAYRLPNAGPVKLRVVDIRGRVVRTLVDEVQPAGPQSVRFDGRDDGGQRLASGLYFEVLRAAGRQDSRKITVLH